jgi:putative transposase
MALLRSTARAAIARRPAGSMWFLISPSRTAANCTAQTHLSGSTKRVKRRADVIGIFPNEAAVIRLIGAVLLEQNDEWQLQQRYLQVDAMAELVAAAGANDPRQIPCAA